MGPLAGIRVVELAGQGPGPHAAMLLGDWGADVVRVVRKGPDGSPADIAGDAQLRNRTLVAADLKDPQDRAAVAEMICGADVFIEGFRPGVTERLRLGPQECMTDNPRLVYARMTGWGQNGPMALAAGHDINYASVTGVLDMIGEPERPTVPLNLLGDFGGGSMFLLSAILAALLEREVSGQGQVLDVAIVDGVNTLAQTIWSFRAMGIWNERRAANILDGGAPYYGVYRCADGRYVAVGAIEQPFYEQVVSGLGLDSQTLPDRDDPTRWTELRTILAGAFASRTREQWSEVFGGTDACVTPVLSMTEALDYPHLLARNAFAVVDGAAQAMPAKIFGRTPSSYPRACGTRVESLSDGLARWGRPSPSDRHANDSKNEADTSGEIR
jgi:alpha-methylacyl-CoA racemase